MPGPYAWPMPHARHTPDLSIVIPMFNEEAVLPLLVDRLRPVTEGMLTDPVYEGKSMAGLIGLVRSGQIPAGSRVLYAHLGGQPALSAYAGYPGLGSPERELSH